MGGWEENERKVFLLALSLCSQGRLAVFLNQMPQILPGGPRIWLYLRRRWHPTPVLLPGKSHGRRSLVGCSPWGLEESDTTERLHFHFSLSCIGEGNGNPLQCSCLENAREGGRLVGCHLWGRTESDTTEATQQQQQQSVYILITISFIFLFEVRLVIVPHCYQPLKVTPLLVCVPKLCNMPFIKTPQLASFEYVIHFLLEL